MSSRNLYITALFVTVLVCNAVLLLSSTRRRSPSGAEAERRRLHEGGRPQMRQLFNTTSLPIVPPGTGDSIKNCLLMHFLDLVYTW